MSADPREGVANVWSQTHDIRNPSISYGNAMTTPGAPNPTLTIVALALRQAEYFSRKMKAHKI